MIVIVLEGVNGSGKTTLGRQLTSALQSAGAEGRLVDLTAWSPHHAALRRAALLESDAHGADSDAVLMAGLRISGATAMRTDPTAKSIEVAIVERWSLAVEAYGTVDGANPDLLAGLVRTLDHVLDPTFTLLLDVTASVAEARLDGLGDLNRFETRGSRYVSMLAATYRDLAAARPATASVDASGTEADVLRRAVAAMVESRLPVLAELGARVSCHTA